MTRRGFLGAAALLSGCGRYADFSLPKPAGAPRPVRFRWSAEPDPVLPRGAAGEWDAVDALNPSIVRRDGAWYNFYSGYDGRAWRTGAALSEDGRRWTRLGAILSPDAASWEGAEIAANGTTLYWRGAFHHWYQAGAPHRLALARSSDGRQWQKHPAPVLDLGPRGSWDERAIGDPYVIAAGDDLYLFYLGMDRARRQRLGLARSRDGIAWTRRRAPLLELGGYGAFDEFGLGEPAVWTAHGAWWMLYTGRDAREHRRLGIARSADGDEWQRVPGFVIAGDRPWNAKVVCDPDIELRGNELRVWFGGGDVASPDQNLHGQIGVGTLTMEI